MTLRTPSTTQSRIALLDLERTSERLVQNQTRIASGSRLTSPADDPTAAVSILSFGDSIAANTQYMKQADTAIGYLSSSENAVAAAINDVQRLMEIAVSGSSASTPELEAIRSNLLSLANTQSQGKYLFSGTNTQVAAFSDTLPVTYNGTTGTGNQGDINLNVTGSTSVTTNIRGDVVFLGGKDALPGNSLDVFQAVKDLETALASNNPAQVKTVSTHLDSILANLSQAQADLGGRQAGLQDIKDTLSGFNINLQAMQDNQQGTDYPATATQVAQDQTIQTATLSVLAKANKTNLFDYLA